jgi:hypothetical protein
MSRAATCHRVVPTWAHCIVARMNRGDVLWRLDAERRDMGARRAEHADVADRDSPERVAMREMGAAGEVNVGLADHQRVLHESSLIFFVDRCCAARVTAAAQR